MPASSSPSEGTSHECPLCGCEVDIDPANPAGVVKCTECGHGVLFDVSSLGDAMVVTLHMPKLLTPDPFLGIGAYLNEKKVPELILDMRSVQFISSAVLGKLISMKKGLKTLRIRNLSPDLLEIFRLTHLDKSFLLE
jgi:hypothetical protein